MKDRGIREKIRVLVVADGKDRKFLDSAYTRQEGVEVISLSANDFEKWNPEPDGAPHAADIALPPQLIQKAVFAVMAKGIPVSISAPVALSLEEAKETIQKSDSAGRLIRIMDPFNYYPPYVMARKMVADGDIGEPSMVRFACRMSESGDEQCAGWADILPVSLYHRIGLARLLFGEIEEVYSLPLGNTSSPVKGCGIIAGWKHISRAKYGVIEIVRSKELLVRSETEPVEDIVEISGTDGILWINVREGQTVSAPPIRIIKGKKHVDLSLQKTDWAFAFREAASRLIGTVRKNGNEKMEIFESPGWAMGTLRATLSLMSSLKEPRSDKPCRPHAPSSAGI